VVGVAAVDESDATLVGSVGAAWASLLPFVGPTAAGEDLPVDRLLQVIEIQTAASRQLGAFMQLVVKCDEANVRTIRAAWERHSRPAGLRALLELEIASGVQQPTRLEEGSASLALLWSMRMKEFWIRMAAGLGDSAGPPMAVVGLDAYETFVEPYHGWLLRKTFRTAIRALPERPFLLERMSMPPDQAAAPDGATEGRISRCVVDLSECLEATHCVIEHVKRVMSEELRLADDRRL